MTPDGGALLGATEVGKQIGRSDDTVRRMWTEGELPYVTVNGRRCTPQAALDQWLAQLADQAMDSVAREQE